MNKTIADIIETPKGKNWQCIPIIKARAFLDYIEQTTTKTNIRRLRKLKKTIAPDKYLDEYGARVLIKDKSLNLDYIEAFILKNDLKKATNLIYTKTTPRQGDI